MVAISASTCGFVGSRCEASWSRARALAVSPRSLRARASLSRRSDADKVAELGGIAGEGGEEAAVGAAGPALSETIGADVVVGAAARSVRVLALKWISAAKTSPAANAMTRPSAIK